MFRLNRFYAYDVPDLLELWNGLIELFGIAAYLQNQVKRMLCRFGIDGIDADVVACKRPKDVCKNPGPVLEVNFKLLLVLILLPPQSYFFVLGKILDKLAILAVDIDGVFRLSANHVVSLVDVAAFLQSERKVLR